MKKTEQMSTDSARIGMAARLLIEILNSYWVAIDKGGQ
jgi:hypothetical protein